MIQIYIFDIVNRICRFFWVEFLQIPIHNYTLTVRGQKISNRGFLKHRYSPISLNFCHFIEKLLQKNCQKGKKNWPKKTMYYLPFRSSLWPTRITTHFTRKISTSKIVLGWSEYYISFRRKGTQTILLHGTLIVPRFKEYGGIACNTWNVDK